MPDGSKFIVPDHPDGSRPDIEFSPPLVNRTDTNAFVTAPQWWRDSALIVGGGFGAAAALYLLNAARSRKGAAVKPAEQSTPRKCAELPRPENNWSDDLVVVLADAVLSLPQGESKITIRWQKTKSSFPVDDAQLHLQRTKIESILQCSKAHDVHINELREQLARGGLGTKESEWELNLRQRRQKRSQDIAELRDLLEMLLT